MYLNQADLANEYQKFLDFAQEKSGGVFTGFSHAYVHAEEGYKGPLGQKAREELQLDTWRPDLIGTGHIKQAVIRSFATRIPWEGKQLTNNLVHWQQVKPFEALPNAEVEAAVYELFKGTASAAVVYERLRDARVTYQITAFLFFLKDPERFLPITQERFDQAFRLLGVQGFKTSHAKSWENYATFLELIGQVRTFLAEKLEKPVSLLDAHSFVYMIASQMQQKQEGRSNMEQAVAAFQKEWPLERVRRMTLAEYAQQKGDTNSFCHWVQHRAKSAGHLGNVFPAMTFGIYHRDPENTGGKAGLHEEGPYLWAEGLTYATAEEAFEEVRSRIVGTIEAAQADELEAISRINGMDLFRWKVAYLYAPDKVVPIYNREHLKAAARELGMPNYQQASYAARHRYILANLPEGMDAFAYMHAFYERNRVEPERGVKYWVVGSTYDYGENYGRVSIYDRMKEEGVVAMGFLRGLDLTPYYLDPTEDVKAIISMHYADRPKDANRAKLAVSRFMQIAPGDYVAIKGYNTQFTGGTLTTIIGYARVIEREGIVYRPSPADPPEGLGQLLNAEFIATDIDRHLPINVTGTVREINPQLTPEWWSQIFGPIEAQVDGMERSAEVLAVHDDPSTTPQGGTDRKNKVPYFRKGSVGREVSQYHNEIQQSYHDLLHTMHVGQDIRMERGYVDIVHVDAKGVHHLYEVKPEEEPLKCIRQALGQLLAYTWSYGLTNALVRLYVVGPQPIDERAKCFLAFIQSQLEVELKYVDHQPTLP